MSEFFKDQYDYIYFFYGLAFFFLAIVCITLKKDKTRTLPWPLLGLFGFIHGINEWLEIYGIVSTGQRILPVVRLFILGLSYFVLFEFARIGLKRLGAKNIRWWMYVFFLAGALSGFRHGFAGCEATIRYFLGFPAGLLSSWMIFRASRVELREKKPLLFLSIMWAGYSITTGIIVPQVNFFPASWMNFDSFYRVSGMPVQFIRGIFALFSSMALWFYSQTVTSIKNKYDLVRFSWRFKPSKWLIMCTFGILIGLGWVFTNYFDYYMGMQMVENMRKESPLNDLTRELAKVGRAAYFLSTSPKIAMAITSGQTDDLEKARVLLIQTREKTDALECTVLNALGKVVLSTETILFEKTEALYKTRPYFTKSLSGELGYYLTRGSDYHERVYYISYPVKDKQGKVLGIVLVKKRIIEHPIIPARLISIVITLVVCIIAIILFVAWGRKERLIDLIEQANKQLRELDKTKNDFISVVSHDLKSPLVSIRDSATLLLRDNAHTMSLDTREKKDLLETIIQNTDYQVRLVNDLLDVSKIEAGTIELRMELSDILALAKKIVVSLQSCAEQKKIKLLLSANKESLSILMDEERTRRVMTNLIDNALKFTAENGTVTVRLEDREQDVLVKIIDTGIGIPADDVVKLFQKFYRASNVRGRRKDGSGLGLVIAKGLIEAQGGTMGLDSELGKGTTFYFTLSKQN